VADYDGRSWTSASVNWDYDFPNSSWETSPDISACVQEVVDRAGWAENNALGLRLKHDSISGTNRATFFTYDDTPSYAAKLNISYTEPTTTTTAAPTTSTTTETPTTSTTTAAPTTTTPSPTTTTTTAAPTTTTTPGPSTSTTTPGAPEVDIAVEVVDPLRSARFAHAELAVEVTDPTLTIEVTDD
jgi:hypothetical protein